MSLVIDADSEWLQATTGAFGTNLTGASFLIWVKRTVASSGAQGYAFISDDLTTNTNAMCLAHNGNTTDSWIWAANDTRRIDAPINVATTSWQMLLLVYEKDVGNRIYAGTQGGSLNSQTYGSASTTTINSTLSQIRLGGPGGTTIPTWYCRAKLAVGAFWDTALTGTNAATLFNGGAAGAGADPRNVVSANLKFLSLLTSDGTVQTGGVSLTTVGSPTFDGADNPNIEAFGGGGGGGSIAAISNYYRMMRGA